MPAGGGYRGGRGGGGGHYNKNHPKPKPTLSTEDEKNPILLAFHGYARELDSKHDRHERIVKLSRDITIEAKRIIFLLHTIDGRKNNRDKILLEAQTRLQKVIENNFKAVAKELLGQDPYQFRGAYSPGLQEFIEAYTFMEYFRSGRNEDPTSGQVSPVVMSDWNGLQKQMQYEEKLNEEKSDKSDVNETMPEPSEKADKAVENTGNVDKEASVGKPPIKFEFHVDPTEYILGLSDLTGELMRRCINSLGSGETETCLETCKVLQQFYTGYISLNVQRCRELSRKIYTMRQSVLKVENVCYNVRVRGGEAAKWGAVFDGGKHAADDVDEGFF